MTFRKNQKFPEIGWNHKKWSSRDSSKSRLFGTVNWALRHQLSWTQLRCLASFLMRFPCFSKQHKHVFLQICFVFKRNNNICCTQFPGISPGMRFGVVSRISFWLAASSSRSELAFILSGLWAALVSTHKPLSCKHCKLSLVLFLPGKWSFFILEQVEIPRYALRVLKWVPKAGFRFESKRRPILKVGVFKQIFVRFFRKVRRVKRKTAKENNKVKGQSDPIWFERPIPMCSKTLDFK